MAYKGKAITVASTSHLISELKDFMVACGWTLYGPSIAPAAQDDAEGFALGWFLRSVGENGQDDIHVHLGLNQYRDGQLFADTTYLSVGVNESAIQFTVVDASNYVAGDFFRIENEMVQVGTVDIPGNNLNGCTRGACGTTAATHAVDKVIQHVVKTGVWDGYACAEVFAFRDMGASQGSPADSHAIAASSGTPTWSIGKASVASVTGIGGFTTNRFNYHTLVQVWDPDGGGPGVPGADHGKMRWCNVYTDGGASGSLTFQQPFKNIAGAKHLRILSGGFLPGFSRRATEAGSQCPRALGTIYHNNVVPAAGMVVYMVGSKDGVAVYTKQANPQAWYFGNCIPFANPLNATLTADVAKGASQISVNNTDLFCVGQKYRLISQDYRDWDSNKTPDSPFPVLDPEEIPTQEVVIATIGTGVVTFTPILKYSFRTGAIVGEDPRPAIRMASVGVGGANTFNDLTDHCWVQCYLPCKKEDLGAHASFRQFWRALHALGAPQTQYNYYWQSYLLEKAMWLLAPTSASYVLQNMNRQTDQFPLYRLAVGFGPSTAETTYNPYGRYFTTKGVVPHLWCFTGGQPPGGVQEDTVKGVWEGAYKTFRILTHNPSLWLMVGPEIWP